MHLEIHASHLHALKHFPNVITMETLCELPFYFLFQAHIVDYIGICVVSAPHVCCLCVVNMSKTFVLYHLPISQQVTPRWPRSSLAWSLVETWPSHSVGKLEASEVRLRVDVAPSQEQWPPGFLHVFVGDSYKPHPKYTYRYNIQVCIDMMYVVCICIW